MPVLSRHGSPLYYEATGQGIPVLMIQGVGVAGTAWEPQVEHLRQRCCTVVFDHRGVGRSQPFRGPISIEAMAEDALAVLDHLGHTSAHVVGHSMGGAVAQQLALAFPQRVRSLSLLCTFARGAQATRLTPWVLWMSLRLYLGTRAMRRSAFLEMILPKRQIEAARASGSLPALAEQMGRWFGRDLADQPPIILQQMRALARYDASSRLAELARIPSLVVSAAEDPIAQPRFGRELATCLPNSRFECLAGATHGVPLAEPERVNQLLSDFLAEAEAATARSERRD